MTVPDSLIPDEHVVLGGPQGNARSEISLEDGPDGRGAYVEGLTPPEYEPLVIPTERRDVYQVKRSGCPQYTVDCGQRECDCRDRKDGRWCIHLRAVAAYRQWRS